MNICQAVPSNYRNTTKLVEISAYLYNGMPHGLFLGDDRCPKRKLQIDYEQPYVDGSLGELDKFVSNNIGNIGLIGNGRFLGIFKQDSTARRTYFSVQKVIDLRPK